MSQMETTSDYDTELEESNHVNSPQPIGRSSQIPGPDEILDHDPTQPIVTRSLSDPLSLPSDEAASTVTVIKNIKSPLCRSSCVAHYRHHRFTLMLIFFFQRLLSTNLIFRAQFKMVSLLRFCNINYLFCQISNMI